MSSESSRAVKIRLEIEVPQGGPEPVVLQQLRTRRLDSSNTTPNIVEPPNGSTTVNARQDTPTGPWIICTTGTNTSPGRPLFYGVYLQGSAPQLPCKPPSAELWAYADNSGAWNFEVPVPSQSGPYTLVVWNDDDNFDPAFSTFNIQHSTHTNCQGSGSGSGGAMVADLLPGVRLPTALYAHVSKAGAGVHPLTYDPNTKAWTTDAVCGPLGFRLVCLAGAWQLHVKSARIYQPSVAHSGPLQIVFQNVDLGTPDCAKGANADVEILVSR